MATALFSDSCMLEHDPGPGHPERRARLQTLLDSFDRQPVAGVTLSAGRLAVRAELEPIHAASYLDHLTACAGTPTVLDPDTRTSEQSWHAGLWAAGSGIEAVRAVAAGHVDNAFVWARPPGHHAERDRAMGFCLLNNVAAAAEECIRLGFERVLIVDWDVHHGNGTQHIFERRSDVLFFSCHQFPFYPGTGAPNEVGQGAGMGFTANCGLPAGMGDADYGAVFQDVLIPIADRYRPEFVLVSAGFDPHIRDPLAQMCVTERGFAAMGSEVCRLAEKHCGGKLVLVLEGGYDLAALEGSARACLEVLAGYRESFPSGAHRVGPAIGATRSAVRAYWPGIF